MPEKIGKIKVYTNLNTLKKVKRILNDIGIGFLLDGNEDSEKQTNIISLLTKLIDDDKIIEFLQAVTKKEDIDFGELEAEKAGEIIEDFFCGISKFLPKFLREKMKKAMQVQISS